MKYELKCSVMWGDELHHCSHRKVVCVPPTDWVGVSFVSSFSIGLFSSWSQWFCRWLQCTLCTASLDGEVEAIQDGKFVGKICHICHTLLASKKKVQCQVFPLALPFLCKAKTPAAKLYKETAITLQSDRAVYLAVQHPYPNNTVQADMTAVCSKQSEDLVPCLLPRDNALKPSPEPYWKCLMICAP